MSVQVHFSGVRYTVQIPAMKTLLRVYCGMQSAEAEAFAERVAAGDRVSVYMEDVDTAYSLASEMVNLGVNAEADEGYD